MKLQLLFVLLCAWAVLSYWLSNKILKWHDKKAWERLEKDMEQSFKDDLETEKKVNDWIETELKKEGLEDEE